MFAAPRFSSAKSAWVLSAANRCSAGEYGTCSASLSTHVERGDRVLANDRRRSSQPDWTFPLSSRQCGWPVPSRGTRREGPPSPRGGSPSRGRRSRRAEMVRLGPGDVHSSSRPRGSSRRVSWRTAVIDQGQCGRPVVDGLYAASFARHRPFGRLLGPRRDRRQRSAQPTKVTCTWSWESLLQRGAETSWAGFDRSCSFLSL